MCPRNSGTVDTSQCEELACPAGDDDNPDQVIEDEPVDQLAGGPAEFQEEEQPEQDVHAAEVMLRRVHANLGHPSKGLMLRLFRGADAPPEIVAVARVFHCPHCDLLTRRTGAVRPIVSRSKELGHTKSVDACHWKRNRDGREALIVNIIDEASRFHVALVLKEGDELRAPALIRVDSEGVETHVWLLKNQLLLMEDEFPEASIDELVERCASAKVRRQTFDGYSPLQWWFGTQGAREVEENGLGQIQSNFERQLEYQTVAQTAFVRADARKTLRKAQYARSRVLRIKTAGQLVRHFWKEPRSGGRRRSRSWLRWKDGSLWSCKNASN